MKNRKHIRDGLMKGYAGHKRGSEGWKKAHREAVKKWRLAGRDKWQPNYGKSKREKK